MNESRSVPLSYEDLETAACTLVGRLIFSLSRFEMNLALYIRDHKGPEHATAVISYLDDSSFNKKLIMLKSAVRFVYGSEQSRVEAFDRWIDAAHEFRA